jgi:hypothetical protein
VGSTDKVAEASASCARRIPLRDVDFLDFCTAMIFISPDNLSKP